MYTLFAWRHRPSFVYRFIVAGYLETYIGILYGYLIFFIIVGAGNLDVNLRGYFCLF
jgi:hypothetical protein